MGSRSRGGRDHENGQLFKHFVREKSSYRKWKPSRDTDSENDFVTLYCLCIELAISTEVKINDKEKKRMTISPKSLNRQEE